MANSRLEQLDEQVKAQQKSMQNMSPEDRLAAFVQARDAEAKNAQKSIRILIVIGVLFLAVAVQQWFGHYHASLPSSLGFLCGALLAIVGFLYVQANVLKSKKIIISDNFTDDELTVAFREYDEMNKRDVEQWRRIGKYLALIFFGMMVMAFNFRFGTEFLVVASFSGYSIFLLSLVVFRTIQAGSRKKAAKQNGG